MTAPRSTPPCEESGAAVAPADDAAKCESVLPTCIVVGLAGFLFSVLWCGHFAKPFYDFYEFHETGESLLRFELPATFKRGPLFSIAVALVGRMLGWAGVGGDLPSWIGAQYFNAVALGANAALTCLILTRWRVAGARWWALAQSVLPWGVYCAAQGIVEPALITSVLATLAVAQRGGSAAFMLAAIASLTRYDVAGLLLGVAVGRGFGGGSWRRAGLFGLAATAPLGVWLFLTLTTYSTRGQEHYISQMLERPTFDLAWSLKSALRTLADGQAMPLPPIVEGLGIPVVGCVWALLVCGAIFGIVRAVQRKDAAAIPAAVTLVGYVTVHALFGFQFDRFGLPAGILLLLIACYGMNDFCGLIAHHLRSRGTRRAIVVFTAIVSLALVASEAATIPWQITSPTQIITLLTVFVVSLVAVSGMSDTFRSSRGWIVLSGACLTVVYSHLQLRVLVPLMVGGHDWANVVSAARWIRDNGETNAGVLSSEAGLYRLLMPAVPRDRFVGFEEIHAVDWGGVLAEARQRKIGYIVWHAGNLELHGRYYFERWRLDRFEMLKDAQVVAGVEVVRELPGEFPLVILQVQQ